MSEIQADLMAHYNAGQTWDDLVAAGGENVDRMMGFFEGFDFDEDTAAFFNGKTPLQILVIGSPSSSDFAQNIAMLARIADEVPGMEISVVDPAGAPELVSACEAVGAADQPVVVFVDMTGRELGRWSGRSASASAWLSEQSSPSDDVYDEQFRETFARDALQEWQRLLLDEDF